ncbi:hypothetical protein AS594_01855 [Streptomyces agglomeratus]|uniref:DUF1877 family protein n=1 Tax=Streptomyces agglomeratus TaxID=285458 RepID=A0A1E5PHZ7_9ACTN|nr:hypothetical protein [Streptomyces agglomeratus]OEJ29157.1 hypothetical protein AS594_01855 [Streptomyces agglomeratus]OEJ56155.1 hypothetical protein BGK72_34040 [Streptomyces agglomeratus]
MGLDINVLIADWSWLEKVPPRERLSRLRDAWYADETGLWDHDAPVVEGDWEWPRGPHSTSFAVYEFRGTLGSFKAHFWAAERWESIRDHADPLVRAGLDTLLLGLTWRGLDGEAEHIDPGFFCDDPAVTHGVLLARSPDSVRKLATTSERVRPRLGELRGVYNEHAAVSQGWVSDFDAFTRLMDDWGHVLSEAARRGWGVVGLSE